MGKATVALVRCSSYEQSMVDDAVVRGIDLLGGISAFARSGERILIKPNILSGAEPNDCVTTHPAVFGAVIRAFKPAGAVLSYGDSPGVGPIGPALLLTGLHGAAQELGVARADFAHGRRVTFRDARRLGSFTVANGVLDADGVVSVAKLKTHGLTRITGAVKNQYGCIPGLRKARYHAQFPLVLDFSEFLADVCAFVNPRLYVLDTIVAMEGNGPNAGTPKHLGFLLLSTDPVAVDVVACMAIHLRPDFVPTNKAGERAGLGTAHENEIDIVGDPLREVRDPGFRVVRKPAMFVNLHRLIQPLAGRFMPKPVIDSGKCTRCGTCIGVCPVQPKALAWQDKRRQQPPRYTYDRCIRCFCCQETCPSRAIRVRMNAAATVLPVISVLIVVAGYVRSLLRRRLRALLHRFAGSGG